MKKMSPSNYYLFFGLRLSEKFIKFGESESVIIVFEYCPCSVEIGFGTLCYSSILNTIAAFVLML